MEYQLEADKPLICPVCDENDWNPGKEDSSQIVCEVCDHVYGTEVTTTQEEPLKIDEEELAKIDMESKPTTTEDTPSEEQESSSEGSTAEEIPNAEGEVQGSPNEDNEDLEKEAEEERLNQIETNPEYEESFNTEAAGTIPEEDDFSNLTEKQKMFCHEYIVHLNGAKAARDAGYSEKTADRQAYEILRKPEIIRYLNHLRERRMERLEISQDDVLRDLQTIKRRSMQAHPVRYKGMPTGVWEFDATAALKAVELQGKHCGMFITQKMEHTAKDGAPLNYLTDIHLPSLSQEQLDQLDAILETSDKFKEEHGLNKKSEEEST